MPLGAMAPRDSLPFSAGLAISDLCFSVYWAGPLVQLQPDWAGPSFPHMASSVRDQTRPLMNRTLVWLRLAVATAGGILVAVAILADRLGLDSSKTFGTGELLLLSLGVALLLLSLLWTRTLSAYKATAIILLNTIVLLAGVELAAIALSTVRQQDAPLPPYYAQQDWSDTYWDENSAAGRKMYQPYVVWRRQPFTGQTITIDSAGIRKTGDGCDAAHNVFMFGGSTMWGWGAPDWLTIPAYFQAGMAASTEVNPCVTNFGDDSYISTQNVIALIKELQSGNVPELVVFYDGINDTLNALQSGKAGIHTYADEISRSLEKVYHRALSESQAFRLVRSLLHQKSNELDASELDALAGSVVQLYLGNYEIVSALAEHFGFEHFFFWQPVISVGSKVLTKEEEALRDELSPVTINFFRSVYQQIESAASQPEYDRLHYIGDIFSGESSQLWMDPWHVTPVGNEMVARAMLETIQAKPIRLNAGVKHRSKGKLTPLNSE